MYYVNEDIKNCIRIFPSQGRYTYARYDMNENPEGLPQDFVSEVVSEITPEFLATYPEPGVFINKYAAYLHLPSECVAVTNGSDMAIRYIMETFVEKGKCVVGAAPSFEMYPVNCSMLGLKYVAVSYESDLTMDVEKIIQTINEDTDLVVLLNPNNPLGNVYSDNEVTAIIEKAGKVGAVVLIDEAYHYFYKRSFIEYVKKYDNVVVLRTFSKLLSLAAVRMGMIIGAPKLIGYVKKAMPSFEVNAVALKFGEHIMDHTELLDELMEKEEEGYAYTMEELKKNGYSPRESHGNFILVKPKLAPKILEQKLMERKILIKTFGNPMLKDYVRISIGSREAMRYLMKAFLEADREDVG